MKPVLAPLLMVTLLAACASSPPVPDGLTAGRFVTLSCAENKSFQVRYADDGMTVRVRSHHGAAELQREGEDRFTGEGYTLTTKGAGGMALDHAGKSQGKACKRLG